jgi:hypothetical protein
MGQMNRIIRDINEQYPKDKAIELIQEFQKWVHGNDTSINALSEELQEVLYQNKIQRNGVSTDEPKRNGKHREEDNDSGSRSRGQCQ